MELDDLQRAVSVLIPSFERLERLKRHSFKWWQTSAPEDKQTLVSRLIDPAYFEDPCAFFFPPEGEYTYGIDKGLTEDDVNKFTGGWDHETKRLVFVNGEFDPWQAATVSSQFRPGGPLKSTPEAPVHLIPGGIHCSDLSLKNAEVNEGVMEVFNAVVDTMQTWVEEFYQEKGKKRVFKFKASTLE